MKKLSIFFTLLASAIFVQAQTIEQTYHFSQPVVSERDGYQQISFKGCLPNGYVGEPTLPWQSVSLILPQGQEAASISMEFSDFMELEGNFNLFPSQQPRPVSDEREIPFAKNEMVYRSESIYPTRSYNGVNTQYLNGVAMAFSGFTPVQYVPALGKVRYARTVKVTVETQACRDDHSRKLWLTPENEASIQRLAQNANLLGSYNKRGREIGGYDMLVITSEEWMPRFGEYLNLYNDKGIRTHIVSLEEIYATTNGINEQEQIRNYIIQEYEGNGIQMVILGGDVSIVPYRSLYCFAQEGDEDQLPSDMYYACLDGSLNDDGDDRWGEVGEDDLLPEIGIGRLPFNNETQFETVMHKTFSYLQNPVLGEFTSPILGAEHLGDGYFGSVEMERLIGTNNEYDYTTTGYPENYNFKRYYASEHKTWRSKEFKDMIGTGGQYVHHVGHANTDYVAGWELSTMNDNYFANNDGINHNFMLFHSHGCICGNFPSNCILEKMVTIPSGFVVTTGNSRYGWYQPWGDGMAAHIHREFVDAYCNDHIPTVGMALREAKIATAPWVTVDGENGYLRWNIYCLNVLGDAALYPWFEEPFNPNVVYEQGLMLGTTSTTVHVSHFDTPLDNFCVSLFDGEILLGRGITDENGNAELVFDTPLDVIGEMQLIVTGQSAWPQTFGVVGLENDQAFVYGDIINLDGVAEFGTDRWVSFNLFNVGDQDANNVQAYLTTDCEYVQISSSSLTVDELAANDSMSFGQGGQIHIADNVPDQTILTLNLNTQHGTTTNISTKNFLILAPYLQFAEIEVDDSQGNQNGFVDPGEEVVIRVHGKNIGHATAPNTYLTISYQGQGESITISDTTIQIGEIESDSTFVAEFMVAADADIIGGTVYQFDFTIQAGSYATEKEYPFAVGLTVETFESGDFSFLEWVNVDASPWTLVTDNAHSGNYCARSGIINDNQTSKLTIHADIINEGEITFWLKTSSEYHRDYLVFYIDGKRKGWWSGENDWTLASFEFSGGFHTFDWVYLKNANNTSGEDCAWIDDITFPRTSLITDLEESVAPAENTIYPNPTTGCFTIGLAEESNISIFNVIGQNILQMEKVSGSQQIQLGNAPKGLYLIHIQGRSHSETRKIIIQ